MAKTRAIAKAGAATPRLHLRLYVAGDSPNSRAAVANIRAVCAEYFPGTSELEIVDVLESPGRALSDAVLVTPTLVRLSPLPLRKVIGNLSDTRALLAALGPP